MPAAGAAGGAARGAESSSAISPSSMRKSTACSTRSPHGLIGVVSPPTPQERSTACKCAFSTEGKIFCSLAIAWASLRIAGSSLLICCAKGGGQRQENIACSAGPLGKRARRAAAHATVGWPEGSGGLARASAGLGSAMWACQLTLKVQQGDTVATTFHVLPATLVRTLSQLTHS